MVPEHKDEEEYFYPDSILQSLASLQHHPMFCDTKLIAKDGFMFAPRILLIIVFPGLLDLLIDREDEVITILLPMFSVQEVKTYFHSLTETLPPSQFLPQTQTQHNSESALYTKGNS